MKMVDLKQTFRRENITTRIVSLLFAFLLIGIDRITKWLATVYLNPKQTVEIINIGGVRLLNFTYLENIGAAFSILEGKRIFLILTTGLLITGALIFLLSDRVKSRVIVWALTLVIAGGAGNLIDRVFYGYVVDFIDLRFISFAVFNFADICAVTGSFMLFIYVIKEEINNSRNKKAEIIHEKADE